MTMTDERETKSMEQFARDHRDGLEAEVGRLRKLRTLNESGRCSDDALEGFEEAIREQNYGAGLSVTVDVTLYGGGPAGGVEFECSIGEHGLEWNRADVWHNDWFQERGRARLDDDVAEELWQLWGLEHLWGGR